MALGFPPSTEAIYVTSSATYPPPSQWNHSPFNTSIHMTDCSYYMVQQYERLNHQPPPSHSKVLPFNSCYQCIHTQIIELFNYNKYIINVNSC